MLGKNITSDILEDFYMIAKEIPSLTKDQRERLYYSDDFAFSELQALLKKSGYSHPEIITEKLLELYTKQNLSLEQEIQSLRDKKMSNDEVNKLFNLLGMIPLLILKIKTK